MTPKTPLQHKTAVALEFDGVNAPRVAAKGSGVTGEAIIQLAREHDIPLHEDSNLAQALSQIPLGEEIPPQLFMIVAEILAYIYLLDETLVEEKGLHSINGSRQDAAQSQNGN